MKYQNNKIVKVLQQGTDDCGVAVLSSLLKYANTNAFDIVYSEVYDKLQPDSITGTRITKLQEVAQEYGLSTMYQECTDMAMLINYVERDKRPVIIMISGAGPTTNEILEEGNCHYVLITGTLGDSFIVSDPLYLDDYIISQDNLLLRWKGIDDNNNPVVRQSITPII